MSESISTGHVGLNVTDLDRSIAFYTGALELEVLDRNDDADRRYAFLGHDGALLLTLWQQASSAFATDRAGLHHLAFLVADVDVVTAVQARVPECGGALVHDRLVAHGEGASSGGVFFTDPDGTRVEVYAANGFEETAPATTDGPSCGFF